MVSTLIPVIAAASGAARDLRDRRQQSQRPIMTNPHRTGLRPLRLPGAVPEPTQPRQEPAPVGRTGQNQGPRNQSSDVGVSLVVRNVLGMALPALAAAVLAGCSGHHAAPQ